MSVNWWVKTYSGDCVINSIDNIHPESIVELTTCTLVGDTKTWVTCLLPYINKTSQVTLPQIVICCKLNEVLNKILTSNSYNVKCQFRNFCTLKNLYALCL